MGSKLSGFVSAPATAPDLEPLGARAVLEP